MQEITGLQQLYLISKIKMERSKYIFMHSLYRGQWISKTLLEMYRELNQWLVILRIFDKNNRIVHWFHHSGSRFVMQCGSWKIVVVPVFVTNILFSKIIVLEAKKSFTDLQLQSKELSGCNNLPSFLPPWQLSYLELWLKWIKHLHDWINIKKSEILNNLQSFFFLNRDKLTFWHRNNKCQFL